MIVMLFFLGSNRKLVNLTWQIIRGHTIWQQLERSTNSCIYDN